VLAFASVRSPGPGLELTDYGGVTLVRARRIYEITFAGEAGDTLRAAFDDCKVITGSGRTTLRVELPDQADFFGLMERIRDLGLELIEVHSVAASR
jgi:hypothetical protein